MLHSPYHQGSKTFAPRFRLTCWRGLAKAVLGPLAAVLLMTSSASAWWNEEWTMRKQIGIDASSAGGAITDEVGTTPTLIRLHAGNFRFNAAKVDGSDLRFVAGDDKTPLKHHVEKFDGLLGEALVWVNVPNVQAGANANIWLYYGNPSAVAAEDSKGTYDPSTLLVYHFGDRGSPAQDSSPWSNNASSVGLTAEGTIIGAGLRLDGSAPLAIPGSQSLVLTENGALTWSAWIKPAELQRNAVIYSRREGTNALVIGIDDGAPFVEIAVNGTTLRSAGGAPVAPGGWHHVAVVATPGLVTLYLDGQSYATLSASLPALNSVALLGGDTPLLPTPSATAAPSAEAQPGSSAVPTADGATDLGAGTDGGVPEAAVTPPVAAVAYPGFSGEVDELSIANTARPAGFIQFAAMSQGQDPSKLILFSADEETASWLSGHFGVLLKSVTLDGWVIIGILMVMAVASWIVVVEKHGYLKRQKKANASFLPAFRRLQDDLTVLLDSEAESAKPTKASRNDRNLRKNSALYRIYQIGAAEIRRRFPEANDGRAHVLSAEAIAAIRSSLDAGLVREMQVLNRLMVILTISISGGPFLGLLGTVIGVMITFAAIAMSGDVNINAIAPGVAGALMATVAGLVVAIPALFGYNWLTLRIKDLTSDLQVFVDEFIAKMAETYSTERPGPVIRRIAAE